MGLSLTKPTRLHPSPFTTNPADRCYLCSGPLSGVNPTTAGVEYVELAPCGHRKMHIQCFYNHIVSTKKFMKGKPECPKCKKKITWVYVLGAGWVQVMDLTPPVWDRVVEVVRGTEETEETELESGLRGRLVELEIKRRRCS